MKKVSYKLNFKEFFEKGLLRNKAGESVEDLELTVNLQKDNKGRDVLSIKGLIVIYDIQKDTIILESYGQILNTLKEYYGQNDFLDKILNTWELYHNNDLQPGTKKQMKCLEEYKRINKLTNLSYKQSIRILDSQNLLLDNGYHYGSGFLLKEIPEEILEDIKQWNKELEAIIEAA